MRGIFPQLLALGERNTFRQCWLHIYNILSIASLLVRKDFVIS